MVYYLYYYSIGLYSYGAGFKFQEPLCLYIQYWIIFIIFPSCDILFKFKLGRSRAGLEFQEPFL